jgi:flagellar hook protein FlgE
MKQSFQSHDVVMGRLDTTRHPDNEANLLNIKDGERKTHEDEVGYEKMFEDSDLKAAKLRKEKPNTDDSMEKQLADLPATGYGHTVDDKKLNKRTAQSDHSKTIEDQLPRKGEQKKSLYDLLVDKYNTKVNLDEKIEVNLEDNAGLYDRKGEEDKSTIEKINEMKDNGHQIIFFTARGWNEYNSTKYWLDKHGFKYDLLICGKPIYDIIIDDRSALPKWNEIKT